MVLPGLRPAPLSVMKRLSVKIMKMTVTMTTTVPHLLYTYFVPRIVINTFEPYLNSPHGPMGLLLLSSEEETETQRCWVIIPGSNYCWGLEPRFESRAIWLQRPWSYHCSRNPRLETKERSTTFLQCISHEITWPSKYLGPSIFFPVGDQRLSPAPHPFIQ